MIRNDIRELLDREPFAPFRLILSSGKNYDVLNPQTTVLMKSEMFIAFPDGERWSLVPLLHIASVETIANGRGRRNDRSRRKRK
jgi:hypothetical protein